MTEDLELENQGENSPAEEALESEHEEGNGKPLTRELVSKIVDREKKKAFEKGKQEALMQLQQEQLQQMQQPAPEQAPQQAPMQQQPDNMGGMPQMSNADIERMIAEKAPQALQDHMNRMRQEQTVDSFVNKMQAAEARHPGLEAKLNDLDYSTLAPIVTMANDMENTADIMKELVDNPMKMGNLLTLMYTQPKLAQKAMHDLSTSIKTNQEALAQDAQARDPMSQLKPSSAGADNGAMSVSDFKKMFRG